MASLIVAPGGTQSIGSWSMGLLGVVVGTALLLGILTPVAGALAALCNLCNCVFWLLASGAGARGSVVITVYLIIMSIVVVLLGPGAFSLDAYLFGPHEIAIPGAPRSRDG
jgi:putative oxidoreductase